MVVVLFDSAECYNCYVTCEDCGEVVMMKGRFIFRDVIEEKGIKWEIERLYDSLVDVREECGDSPIYGTLERLVTIVEDLDRRVTNLSNRKPVYVPPPRY